MPDRALAAEALEQLGPTASRWIWALLGGETDESVDVDVTQERHKLLLETVQGWPVKEVLAQLKGISDPGGGAEGQAALLEMLSVIQSPLAVGEALTLLEGLDPLLLRGARFKHLAAEFVRKALNGPPPVKRALFEGISAASTPLCEVFIQSINPGSHPAAPRVLVRLAERHPASELQVLRQLSGIDAVLFGTDDRSFVQLAQRGLASDDRLSRRAAVQAAGRWNLPDLFLDVVAALDDDDPRVRTLASGALGQMTGIKRTWGQEEWRTWYDDESRWLRSIGALHGKVLGADPFTAASASTEFAKHPLMASTTNALLRDGLSHKHPRVRMVAIRGLVASRHSTAVLPLISALGGSDEAITNAAHQALKSISGQKFPAETSQWEDWWADLNAQAT